MKNRNISVQGGYCSMAAEHPDQAGNMRDVAMPEQLVTLSNLESINAVLIHQGLPASERLTQLNAIAITQMRSLVGISAIKQLGNEPK